MTILLPRSTRPGLFPLRQIFARRKFILLFYWLAFTLAACTGGPELLTVPPPLPVRVALPPSLEPTRAALTACARNQPGLALLVEPHPSAFIDLSEVDLALWLGDMPEFAGFAAPLTQEQIVLIVNSRNPLDKIDPRTLAKIFSGEIATWEQIGIPVDGEITLWIYPQENEIQHLIESALLQDGRISPAALIAADPEILSKKVEDDHSAIGFLPTAWLTSSVKAVEIEGIEIELPVLVLAAKEPQGLTRQFLACLQGPIGQQNLAAYYRSKSP